MNLLKGNIVGGLLFISLISTSQAHNMVGMVYVIGDTIEGEIGFSNGAKADAGHAVIVYDEQGEKVGQTSTQAQGVFTFTPTQYIDYTPL